MTTRTIFKDGIYDISNNEYHNSTAVSRSGLMYFNRSHYHYWYEYLSGLSPLREATPAMNIGSAFHTILLEPHLFDNEFAVAPSVDRRTKAGKELYESFSIESANKIILTIDQYEKAKAMADSARQHEIVNTLLDGSVFEQSIFWTDEETGLQFKTRPDIWSSKMIVDLKTIANASPHAMQRSALDYGYFLQAGMAFEACKAIGKPFEMFVILACEKEDPYLPAVYMMNNEALQFGIDQFTALKRQLKYCLDVNKWEGYGVQELSVPAYAIRNLEVAA